MPSNEASATDSSLPLGARIPDDLWLHKILPCLPLADVLSVGKTCHRLHALTTASWLWRTRVRGQTPALAWVLDARPDFVPASSGEDDGQDEAEHAAWVKDAGIGIESARLYSLDVTDNSWRFVPHTAGRSRSSPESSGGQDNKRLLSGGPPPFTQIQSVMGSVLGLDFDGRVWLVNTSFMYRGARYYMYGRLPLPFRVVAVSADNQHATVLSSSGHLWELRGIARWLSGGGDANRGVRGVRHEHHVFATGDDWRIKAPPPSGFPSELVSRLTSAEPSEPAVKVDPKAVAAKSRRVVQLFAAARTCCPYLGGCVTADGRMHIWLRTQVIAHARHCRWVHSWAAHRGMPSMWYGVDPGFDRGEHMVHTLPDIPVDRGRLSMAAMGDNFVVALVGEDLWAVSMMVGVTVKFSAWKKLECLSPAERVVAYGRVAAVYSPSSDQGHLVRLALLLGGRIRHTRTIIFPDPVAEVALSDDVLAAITTKGEIYTIEPHAALSSPDVPSFHGGFAHPPAPVRRHLHFMLPPRVPFVFTLCVDRKSVYVMAFAPPAREPEYESAAEVALRHAVVRKRLRFPPPKKAKWWTRVFRALRGR